MLESGVSNTVSKYSTLLIYSLVRERNLNTENVPSRVNGILSPVSSSNIELSSALGTLQCILGLSCSTNPASLSINGCIKLCSMDGTQRAFLTTSRYVCPDCGQSLAITASTIGTLGMPLTSSVNDCIFAYWSLWLKMNACLPMTTILACEYNSVLDYKQTLSPLLEIDVIILSINCSLGSMHNSPIAYDVGCWNFTSSIHLESLCFLIIALRHTAADAAAYTGSGGACLAPEITMASSVISFI